MKDYRIERVTESKDMYKSFAVMMALNNNMTESNYKDFVDLWATRGYRQFIAYSGEIPVSVIAVIDTPLMDAVPNKAFKIANVATLPTERGWGVSLYLMSHVLNEMRKDGYVRADLNCFKSNERGSAFYKKAGFTTEVSNCWVKKLEQENVARSRL